MIGTNTGCSTGANKTILPEQIQSTESLTVVTVTTTWSPNLTEDERQGGMKQFHDPVSRRTWSKVVGHGKDGSCHMGRQSVRQMREKSISSI